MEWIKNYLFEKQIFQHTAALYFQVPIRELKKDAYITLYQELKVPDSVDDFYESIETKLLDINSFDVELFNSIYDRCEVSKINSFVSKLYTTYHSNYPNLFRELKNSKKFWFYTFLISALISYKISSNSNETKELVYLNNFKIKYIPYSTKIITIGPLVDIELDKKWYEKIKSIFSIENQIYELITLYENITYQDKDISFDEVSNYFSKIDEMLSKMDKIYSKDELIKISTLLLENKVFSLSDLDRYDQKKILKKLSKRRKERDISYADYFDNILYEKGTFAGFEDKDELKKLINRLTKNINAEYAIYYEYDKNEKDNKLTKFAYGDLSDEEEKALNKTIKDMNTHSFKSSLTYKVISDFEQTKEVSALIIESQNDIKLQPFKGTDTVIKSLLSFPIVFDGDIKGVLHFVSKREKAFNKYDEDFIFRLLKPIVYQHMSSKFQREINAILSEFDKIKEAKSDFNTLLGEIFANVAIRVCSIFSADAASIWFNKREILKDPKEIDNINLIATYNMCFEKFNYQADKDSYIMQKNGKELISIYDIESETSSIKDETNYLTYKKELLENGFRSLFIHILKKGDKTIGAIVIANKSNKRYNKLSERMLSILSSQINSMLSILEHIVYKNQKKLEKNFHDSTKFLNMIDSSTRLLLDRVKELDIKDGFLRQNIYYNIGDIKNFSNIAREFITALLKGKEFSKDSNALLKFQIDRLKNSAKKGSKKRYKIRDVAISILKSYEERFNQKQIEYNKDKLNPKIYTNLDRYILYTVLLNIIDNAWKYSYNNTKIILEDEVTPNGYYIYIKNVGFKIKDSEKITIFKEGRRAYAATSSTQEEHKESQTENKGLGLYYASVLAKEWGGSVSLKESKPISSALAKNTFSIYIPYYYIKEVK